MGKLKRNQPGSCACCGRPLTDPESLARNLGPECQGSERCVRRAAERTAPKRFLIRHETVPGFGRLMVDRYVVVDGETGERFEACHSRDTAAAIAGERNADAYLAGSAVGA